MATIQASYFTKKGTADFGTCEGTTTDDIQVESIVTFPVSEQGVYWWMNWKLTKSDGSVVYTTTVYVKATATTTFQSGKLSLAPGTYTIAGTNLGRV